MKFVATLSAAILFLLVGATSTLLPSRATKAAQAIDAIDGSQWGGSSARNNAREGKDLPVQWNVGTFDKKTGEWSRGPEVKNVRWVAKLGSESYGSAIVAGDRVFCATNNAGRDPRYPSKIDLGCLVAFRAGDGGFLWQYSAEKLKAKNVDYAEQGICSSPVIEGNRLWIVTNRSQVVCLDTTTGGVIWAFDMMQRLGSVPRYMTSCSPTVAGELVLSGTSNGVDTNDRIPAPEAPSFIALDKESGKVVWSDNSPGRNILDGQWSSPAFAVLGGVPQVIFAGGDGWIYSFQRGASPDGKARLLWKFDCNPKDAAWETGGAGRRNNIIATPVICDGRVFAATGQDPEAGEGEGDLWCIDPTRRGDVSPDLVVDREGKAVAPARILVADPKLGQQVKANPNSAAVWHYQGKGGGPKDGKPTESAKDFKAVMHRSLGMPVIHQGLLVIGDFSGLVHCLDAKTGKACWTYDMLSAVWGSALVADGKIYLGDQDGDVVVFEHAPTLKVLAKNAMGNAVYGTPTTAGNMLYISTRTHLFAISGK